MSGCHKDWYSNISGEWWILNDQNRLVQKNMKISEYVKDYTSNRPIRFLRIFFEVRELIEELIRFNIPGIKEEFGDTLHFIQMWLYWRFGMDGNIWKVTRHSVKKFVDRKPVWNKIYVYVGLKENVSNYVGNYNRVEKVVSHLGGFGIERELAEEAHRAIVKIGIQA